MDGDGKPYWLRFANVVLLLLGLLSWELVRSLVRGPPQSPLTCNPTYLACEKVILQTALHQNASNALALQAVTAAEEADSLKGRVQELEQQLSVLRQDHLRNASSEWFGCDLTHYRSDICRLIGDVRVGAATRNAVLYVQQSTTYQGITVHAQPYPAKPEPTFMRNVSSVSLSSVMQKNSPEVPLKCSHRYGAPGLLFSVGGFTGVTFHTYNEGLIPLYITAEQFKGEVVLLIEDGLDKPWWFKKFGPMLKRLTNYKPVLLGQEKDTSVHCFRDLIVGLRYHSTLFIIPEKLPNRQTTYAFANFMSGAYGLPELQEQREARGSNLTGSQPLKLALTTRTAQYISNVEELKGRAEARGFEVRVLTDAETDETNAYGPEGVKLVMEVMQWADALLGVYDGALTHHILMRPGSMLVQVVPFGIKYDLAKTSYKRPALRNKLLYAEHLVTVEESSVGQKFPEGSPEVTDPLSVLGSKGWDEYERIYILEQTMQLSSKTIDRLLTEMEKQLGEERSDLLAHDVKIG